MTVSSIPVPVATPSLEEQVARLHALLDVARQVHSTLDSREVLEHSVRLLVRELELDGAVLTLAEHGHTEARYGKLSEKTIVFPVQSRSGVVLAQLTLSPPAGRTLSPGELDFLEGLMVQTAAALENSLLHQRDLHWARMRQELAAARQIQRSLVPSAMPSLPGYSLACCFEPCFEVGGDYLEVLSLADGSCLLIVADVAGKGLPSAIVAMNVRTAVRVLAGQGVSLAGIAAAINRMRSQDDPALRRLYMTAILARLDTASGSLEMLNAGHCAGFVVYPDGSTRHVESTGTPFGIAAHLACRVEQVPFPRGSRLLLYSDGFTEIFAGREEFGTSRLLDAFASSDAGCDASALLSRVWDGVHGFRGAGAREEWQTDDMTALVLHHGASPREQP